MSKMILFVCQSCRTTHLDESETQSSDRTPAEGTILLDRLSELHQTWERRSEVEIQAVGCLWTCDHPCAVALSSRHQSTYMIANVPVAENPDETAEALLCLSEVYLESKDSNIPWKKFPKLLQTDIVARIPSSDPTATHES